MKVFFAASVRGLKEYDDYFTVITDFLIQDGHELIYDYKNTQENNFYDSDPNFRENHYKKVMTLLRQADIVILDLTIHSLSMGYVLHESLSLNKPVIGLFLEGKDPAFAEGIVHSQFSLYSYTKYDIRKILRNALYSRKTTTTKRFTLALNPNLFSYLDWVRGFRKIAISTHIRNILEKEMLNDLEYQQHKASLG